MGQLGVLLHVVTLGPRLRGAAYAAATHHGQGKEEADPLGALNASALKFCLSLQFTFHWLKHHTAVLNFKESEEV